MIPQKAISLAIEEGWSPIPEVKFDWKIGEVKNSTVYFPYPKGGHLEAALAIIALDPTFWQALGKALGWHGNEYLRGEWYWQARQHHDLILTGGDTEKFWNELL